MSISAAQVKELRETTGLGMMVCKRALSEANGDMKRAIETLRKQGQATALKRAEKSAKEGMVTVIMQDSVGLIYEVNSETDFVARNDDFVSFAEELGRLLSASKPADMDGALALKSDAFGGLSVADKLTELMGKIGEKIKFRRFNIVKINSANQRLASYVHGNGKIGVLVLLSANKPEALGSEAVSVLGKELAMQIAAAGPIAVDRASVPHDVLEEHREIFRAQAQQSGRPENVWDKIVEGKLAKFYKESTLLEQQYIRDPEISVADRVKQAESQAGCALAVESFVRYERGQE